MSKSPDLDTALITFIRTIAEHNGYAIGIHGSLERDIDLIAAPWISEAVSSEELIEIICNLLNAKLTGRHTKPLGRIGYVLKLNNFDRLIDISVCPRLKDETV